MTDETTAPADQNDRLGTAADVDACASTPEADGGAATIVDPLLSAPVLAALERTWAAIRRRHPDLPPVVMVLASGSDGAPAGWLKLGHFAAMRWEARDDVMAEVFIGGEGLARGAQAVLATLLHEAAHALAHVRGIKDTSRQGRYHNQRYAELAESLGLQVSKIDPIGWSNTQLTDQAGIDYADALTDLGAALTIFRRSELGLLTGTGGDEGGDRARKPGTPTRPKTGNNVAARCGCGRRVRIARSVLEAGPITCGLCGDPFTVG